MDTITEFIEAVAARIQDDAEVLNPSDIKGYIKAAVYRYSRVRPESAVADITGDGGYDYDYPTGYVHKFSVIKGIEYPAGERAPEMLDADEWMHYETAAAKKIRFLEKSPSSSETVRVTFTIPQTVDSSSTTIPVTDHDAVCDLAGGLCCEALATHYVNVGDSTIGADVVNYRTKSQEYSSRARRLKDLYHDHLGIKEGAVVGASGVADMDINLSTGYDRLTKTGSSR